MIKQNNLCMFVGNLGNEPDVRYTADGRAMAKFSIALDMGYKTKDGQKVDRTTWVQLTAWGGTAETVQRLLDKGMKIQAWCTYSNSVSGEGDNRQYFHSFNIELFTVLNWNGKGQKAQDGPGDDFDEDDDCGLNDPDEQPW